MSEVKLLVDFNSLLMYGSNFFIIFLVSIAGAITRETYAYKKELSNQFRLAKCALSAFLSTIVMLATLEYVTMSFPVVLMICYFFGMWGYYLIGFIVNAKYVVIVFKNIFKEIGGPILKGTANAIDEIKKDEDDRDKSKDTKDESEDDQDKNEVDEKADSDKSKESNNKSDIDRIDKKIQLLDELNDTIGY